MPMYTSHDGSVIDDVRASILILDREITEEFDIKNAYESYGGLSKLERGDYLNIKDVGRLKVTQVFQRPVQYSNLQVMILSITAMWMSDYWEPALSMKVLSALHATEKTEEQEKIVEWYRLNFE